MLFSEAHLEIDVQELCSKYNLNYPAFFEIKEIVRKNLLTQKLDNEVATLFYMDTKNVHCILHELRTIYPFYFAMIRHGDMIFDSAQSRICFFIKKENEVSFIYYSSASFIPDIFKAIDEFPVDYWECPNEIVVSGKKYRLNNISYDELPISENIQKRIQPLTKDKIHFLLRHDPEYFDDYVPKERWEDLESCNFLRYNNKVYVISSQKRKNYIPYDEMMYENDVPSRWGIFKALIWLLILHKKAVITANHPERKRERNEFNEL